MAIERNPLEQIMSMSEQQQTNVIPISGKDSPLEGGPTFEIEEDGSVTVNFEDEDVSVEFDEGNFEGEENWYENLAEKLDEDLLQEISTGVVDRYNTDKNSREEWESMFEKGFDLLGLKLETTSEPFEGACTAVHPLLIESAVKFQSKASQNYFLQVVL